jgi:serine/threonine protein kinase
MNKSIENYTLGDTIGRGSYAKVKRCVNRSTSLPYAIKIFNKLLLQKKKRLVAGRYLADFE